MGDHEVQLVTSNKVTLLTSAIIKQVPVLGGEARKRGPTARKCTRVALTGVQVEKYRTTNSPIFNPKNPNKCLILTDRVAKI